MRSADLPWYWSWRGWRASTWLVLCWTAIMWPAIVSTARSDELLSGTAAAVVGLVWAAGVGVIALGRFLAGRLRPRIKRAGGAGGGRLASMARTALSIAAALVLVYLVAVPLVLAWNAPSDVEAAVEREWRGPELTVPIGFGIGGSEPGYATAPVTAEDVSCDETEAELDGTAVHACTIVHCDVREAGMFGCEDSISPACVALVGDQLVLVGETWSAGSSRLRDRMRRLPECTF